MLETLERANLFIVPLDGERHWYRYHHLFGDLLHRRLLHHQPEAIAHLHDRASDWFEANNLIEEAVDHALVNCDIRRAAQLIQNHAGERFQHGGLLALVDWIQTLPDDISSSQPWQTIYQGWVLIVWMLTTLGRHASVEPLIDQLESILKSEKVNPAEEQELFANITAMRVHLADMSNDQSQIIELTPGFEKQLSAHSLWASSLCHWAHGMDYRLKSDYQNACESFRKAVRDGKAMNNAWISVVALTDLAEVCLEQGQLYQANAIYEEALTVANEPGSKNVSDMGPVEAGLALIKYEQNDLTTAHHLALNGVRHSSSPNQYVFTNEILARILLAQDDFLGSLEAINQVDKISRSYPVRKMLISSTEQTRVRIWIAQDDTLAIEEWLAEYRESAISDEILSLTLARIYMYQNKLDEALSLLNHLGSQVISDQRKNLLIETLVLQSVVLLKQNQIGQALEKLENSLDMAAPQGYVRIYVDAGLPMLHLLLTARSREIHADYIHHLLIAFPGVNPEQIVKPQTRNSEFDWIEPLSDREIDVLQLLSKGLTNQAVADRLVLSIHTVKAHTRSIYSKLAVNNRTQAVDRARTLGVLPPI